MRNLLSMITGEKFAHSFVKELVIGLLIAGLLGLLHECRRALREVKTDGIQQKRRKS
jgi:hypothetical protein